jgi:hypothetical protein
MRRRSLFVWAVVGDGRAMVRDVGNRTVAPQMHLYETGDASPVSRCAGREWV